jgi:uncharacterized phage protein (TIGR01671 family)
MSKRETKYRMWNNSDNSRYFYVAEQVFECLKQQMIFNEDPNNKLGYDHVGDGNYFELYTGRNLENGKYIYERDILKLKGYHEGKLGSVEWNDNYAMFMTTAEDHGLMSFGNVTLEMALRHGVEIIGNIHQDPELLK